jgi:hypothetical protein
VVGAQRPYPVGQGVLEKGPATASRDLTKYYYGAGGSMVAPTLADHGGVDPRHRRPQDHRREHPPALAER